MSQHLSFPRVWEGSRRTSQGQNRTREIRPSGIVGGPMETWVMGVGLRPGGKSPESPPNPKAVARHSSIPTIVNSGVPMHPRERLLYLTLGWLFTIENLTPSTQRRRRGSDRTVARFCPQ